MIHQLPSLNKNSVAAMLLSFSYCVSARQHFFPYTVLFNMSQQQVRANLGYG